MRLFLCKSESYLLAISIIFLIAFGVFYIFAQLDIGTWSLISRDLLCCYLLLAILLLHKSTRYISCIMLFVSGFIFFNCSRIFLSYFNIESITESDKYVFYTFSEKTVTLIISLLGLSITSAIIGYLIRNINCGSKIVVQSVNGSDYIDQLVIKWLKLLIIICIPGLIYKSFYELYLIKTYGYLILYMEMPPAPIFARISWGAFNILFPMLFMFKPSKKEFKQYVIFFLVVSSASFLKGSRSTLLCPLLFFMWYYYTLYRHDDISIKKIFLTIIFVALIANLMLLLRGGAGIELNIFILIFLLLQTQGVTYVFIGNYLDYANTFANPSHWYVLFPFVSAYHWFLTPVYRGGQTEDLVKQTLNLDDQLMYSVAPEQYLQGAGYGSSYIAELHALGGGFSIILGSLVLGIMINWYEKKCLHSKMLLYFSWFAIPQLIWLSRSSFIPDFFMFLLGGCFYYVTRTLIKYYLSYNRGILL